MCRSSKAYQGHGWGMAWLDSRLGWRLHRSIRPIWEDIPATTEDEAIGDSSVLPNRETHLLVVHARSAFKDEGIAVENNMPFFDGRQVFLFNGELHGVKLRVGGRIGAEKVFNFIRRLQRARGKRGFFDAISLIRKRTRYLKAMNLMMTDGKTLHLASHFSEDPDYFGMVCKREPGLLAYCSQPLDDGPWLPIDNGTERTMVLDPIVANHRLIGSHQVPSLQGVEA